MDVNGYQQLFGYQNIFFHASHKKTHTDFGTTWGWVNNDSVLAALSLKKIQAIFYHTVIKITIKSNAMQK